MRPLISFPRLAGLFGIIALVLFGNVQAADPVRVACLGDSITAGATVNSATQSYPAQLQKMLGDGFVVKNFGQGGASFWHGGNPHASQQLPGATAFDPQIAVVMFGINDTRSRDGATHWAHFSEFDKDAGAVLEALLALPAKPRVLLCLPTENVAGLPGMTDARKASVAERLPRLVEVRAKITALAEKYAKQGVTLVDLHTPTVNRNDLFNVDGVHLNVTGYRLLAETLCPVVKATATTLNR